MEDPDDRSTPGSGAAPSRVEEDGPSDAPSAGRLTRARRFVSARRATTLTVLFISTLVVQAIVTFILGFENLELSQGQTLVSIFGIGIWFATGLSCIAAAYGLWRRHGFWVGAGFLSQGLVLGIALYITMADLRSQVPQWKGITALAAVAAVVAVIWMFELRKYVSQMRLKRFPAIAGTTAAVTGTLLGLLQGWYQTDYLPRSAWPRVDLSTQLVEVGRTGSTVHLSAKISLENKGAVEAESIGSVMRIVAYPEAESASAPPSPRDLAHIVDLGYAANDEYRSSGLDISHRKLLYANDFMQFHAILTPGMKAEYQYDVDVDASRFKIARLTAMAVFFSGRRLDGKVEPCSDDLVLASEQPLKTVVTTPIKPWGYEEICFDSEVAPRNVVEKMVSDRPWIRYHMLVEPPTWQRDAEIPFIYFEWMTADSATKWTPWPKDGSNRFEVTYPNVALVRSSEITVADEPEVKQDQRPAAP